MSLKTFHVTYIKFLANISNTTNKFFWRYKYSTSFSELWTWSCQIRYINCKNRENSVTVSWFINSRLNVVIQDECRSVCVVSLYMKIFVLYQFVNTRKANVQKLNIGMGTILTWQKSFMIRSVDFLNCV